MQNLKTRDVKINVHGILAEAVERGIEYGWHRAHKHTDTPKPDNIKDEIYNGIMNELCEIFIFDEYQDPIDKIEN